MVKSCYIHIPFCEKICSYCDFCKLYYKEEWVNQYLSELETEIDSSYQQETLNTIYIGGGTPSCLNLKQLEKLLKIVNKLKRNKDYEYTIECNFDSIHIEKLKLLKKYGINRISFGLESVQPKNLKVLERKEDKEEIRKKIQICKELGFNNINVDLIYALKEETIADLKKDIEFIKSLDISHISTYSLMIEPHTKLYLEGYSYISEDLDRQMYDCICEELKDWDHYEISNFAKNKKNRSRHNSTYWKNEEYYGFGLSASGYLGNIRYEKTKSLTNYLNHDYSKKNGIEFLTEKDKIYYEVILNLRTSDGINLESFQKKYSHPLEDYYSYQPLIEKGYLIKRKNNLLIPHNLWYISNKILVELLEGEVNE